MLSTLKYYHLTIFVYHYCKNLFFDQPTIQLAYVYIRLLFQQNQRRTALAFLSFKGLPQVYLVKTSITHNKYLTPQFLEDNDPISYKSAAQILSLYLP